MNVKVKRPISVSNELVAVAKRHPIERIWNEIAVGVVGCHGPERIDRREFTFFEMENISVAAVERLACAVNRKRGINGVLRQILAEAAQRDGGAIRIVDTVNPAAGGIDPACPAFTARLLGELGEPCFAIRRASFESLLDAGGHDVEIEALTQTATRYYQRYQ